MKRTSFLALLLWCGTASAAEWGQFEYDFEADKKPWEELQTQLPPPAKTDALTEFTVGGRSGHRYFFDAATLSAGSDGVVRYTLVVKSRGGATNVTFEGMRCVDGERKIYAFGQTEGQWSRNKYARWEPIDARSDTSPHKELFFHYFCTVDGAADLKTIRRAIERGGLRRGGD